MEIEYTCLLYNKHCAYKFHYGTPFHTRTEEYGWKILINEISYDNADDFIEYAIKNLKLLCSNPFDAPDTREDLISWSHDDLKKELHKWLILPVI